MKIQKCYLTTAKDVVGVKCCTSLTSYTLPWTTCVIYITALQVLRGAVDSDVPLWPLGTTAYSQAAHSWHPKAPSPNAPLIVLRGPAAPTLALCYLCSLFTAENTSASSIHLCLRLKIYFAHKKVSWFLYFFGGFFQQNIALHSCWWDNKGKKYVKTSQTKMYQL